MPAEYGLLEVRAILAGTELFGELDEGTLDAISGALELTRVAGGTHLFSQGEAGDAAYLVLSGRLRVERPKGGHFEVVREVGRGELVGELSLLTGAPRSASVRAVRDSEVGRMARDRFDRLLVGHPVMAIRITRMLARLLAAPPQLTDTISSIKTVAVRGLAPEADREVVAEGLARALGAWGRTALVSSQVIDAQVSPDASSAAPGSTLDRDIGRWLDRLEQDHTYVVYLTDATANTWTRRCQRQADLILDVAGSGKPPAAQATALVGDWTSRDLVIVHPPGTLRPAGTSLWTANRPGGRRHHLRVGHPEDFARMARRLSGRAVALALSGGGARGLAHLGLLRAIEELDIPVDEIGGTSMGSVIAAQYAAGFSLTDMVKLNRHGWQHYRPHKAYTIPFSGIVSHHAAQRMLGYMFGNLQFEDCWLETFACSASLTRSQLVVHRTGSVAEALLASIALPGVAAPIVSPLGELLVDGGIINNLPAGLFTRGAEGAILACNASPIVEQKPGYSRTPTSWRVLRDRLFGGPARPYYPSMFETLYRAGVVGSVQETRRVQETADLYLQPPVDSVAIFDFGRIDEIVEIGYRSSLEQLAPWWTARTAGQQSGRRTSRVKV